MGWQACYPEGKRAALTFSYDDGQVHDRRLVGLLNRYALKGTFHLNSATLGHDGFVTSGEVSALYAGHEVACHGKHHHYLTHLTAEQLVHELWEDRRSLESISNYPVTGLSYAFGVYSDEVIRTAQTLGFEYARTVDSTGSFLAEHDFMRWKPTCHHHDAADCTKQFIAPREFERLRLFYIWGHSYEFERDNNWQEFERLCETLAFRDDVWYATNIEIKRYLCAVRALISTADNTAVYNPSAQTVSIDAGGIYTIAPGQTLHLAQKTANSNDYQS